jgi:hypothetical protein
MALSLSRNATVILSYQDSTATAFDGAGREPSEANTFEIPVLDGFSFSQATGTQNVTLNEAGASPKRGQSIFNTSIEPVDWSFTTYIRPRIDDLTTDLHGMTEKILWNALVSGVKTDNVGTGGITSTAATCTVDFEEMIDTSAISAAESKSLTQTQTQGDVGINTDPSQSHSPGGGSASAATTAGAKVRVYATNYNVLRIMSGMGGLAYSN